MKDNLHESQVGLDQVEEVQGNETVYEKPTDFMSRRKFLYILGAGVASAVFTSTLSGCETKANPASDGEDTPVDTDDQYIDPENVDRGTPSTPEVEAPNVALDINQRYVEQYVDSGKVDRETYEKEIELMQYLPEGASLWKLPSQTHNGKVYWEDNYYVAVESLPTDAVPLTEARYLIIDEFGDNTHKTNQPRRYNLDTFLDYSKDYYYDNDGGCYFSQEEIDEIRAGHRWEMFQGIIYPDGSVAHSEDEEPDEHFMRIATRQ